MSTIRWPGTISLGERTIGTGCPVFVVAEAGVNHNGRLDTAIQMVRVAAAAGADAVKFQAFSAESLVTASAPSASYQNATAGQRELLEELELSPLELAQVKAECDARGLLFLATPFSPRDVVNLMSLDVRALKIASPDVTNPPLLRVAGESGLPIIMSTGACTLAEVEAALDVLHAAGCRRLALLHCVSAYPTPADQANLRTISTLSRFGAPVGYSDHTVGSETGGFAVAAGATILEKHFTLRRSQNGPDHFFSLEPDDLKCYVTLARRSEAMMGHGRREPTPAEQEVRRVARSSVVSATTIPAGVRIQRDMLTIKRPGGGIEPARLEELLDCLAQTDIPPDTVINWNMVRKQINQINQLTD